MNHKNLIKIIAIIISASVIFTSLTTGGVYSFADDEEPSVSEQDTTKPENNEPETTTRPAPNSEEVRKKLESQRKEFEASLAEIEKKLEELAKESKATEEYINALDEKIGYLNEELTILDAQIYDFLDDIDVLEKEIEENQLAIDTLQAEVDAVEARLQELQEMFDANYAAYCIRMRSIYISGNFGILAALLTSKDLSGFMTRYQMIKAISKSDAKLLSDIEEETASILEQESDLNDKKLSLTEMRDGLLKQMEELQAKKDSLSLTQEQIAIKKASLSLDKAESDRLFAELTEKNGMYTEFRNEDKRIKQAVEKEISDLINGLIKPEDVTFGTTSDRSEVTETTHNFTDIFSNTDAVLNMTYPVPGYYRVSAGYPNYSNGSYHGGIDFPCPTGSTVVAAQSGQVISVKKMDTSYGYYIMIYHGTDAKGRTVVTLYAHNSQLLVSVGDSVAKGQQIARSGSTGNSTGPHCHFEIRINNAKTNPANYLSK